jgi:V8-like Glu-specific endopeptidase
MRPETIATIAADLLAGKLDEPSPTDLAAAVGSIVDSLTSRASAPSAPEVRSALKKLNALRHFEHTKNIGAAWHDTRGCDATIQRHYAQAMIELGALDAADALLNEALASASTSTDLQFSIETAEYRGLRGRIRKQRFVASGEPQSLVDATAEYLAQYNVKKQYYHGINIVALRTREEELGLPAGDGTTTELAEEVLKLAIADSARDSKSQWPLATASEACLALNVNGQGPDWCDRAELWLYRFLNHPQTDPFSVESYGRQLREIWRGNPLAGVSCADRLASIVERHVTRTERRWAIDPRKVQEIRNNPEVLDVLEKNFSGEKTFTVETLKGMLGLCPCIGCVIDPAGARLGTGFLMAGSHFGLQDALVFVTNAHVISDTWQGSIPAAQAKVTFEIESVAAGAPVPHAVKQILFTSDPGELGEQFPTPEKLDVTIVSLASAPENVSGLKPADNVPLPSPKLKAFVVGHPASGPLQFALHDSVLLDVCDYERLMHYRTPTDPGSSGSPVFNSKWEVIGLHHAGSPRTPRLHGYGEYEANEAITMRAIRRKLGVT